MTYNVTKNKIFIFNGCLHPWYFNALFDTSQVQFMYLYLYLAESYS
jgi:hypothetical protein